MRGTQIQTSSTRGMMGNRVYASEDIITAQKGHEKKGSNRHFFIEIILLQIINQYK